MDERLQIAGAVWQSCIESAIRAYSVESWFMATLCDV
jgi:hypothetical protein